MKVLGKNIINNFKDTHASSRKALDRWVRLMESTDFKNTHDLKQLFGGNIYFVKDQTVFDVGGNKIRAITRIQFGLSIILVTHVLTHSEYDANKWKD